jgi:hypothetical protein
MNEKYKISRDDTEYKECKGKLEEAYANLITF